MTSTAVETVSALHGVPWDVHNEIILLGAVAHLSDVDKCKGRDAFMEAVESSKQTDERIARAEIAYINASYFSRLSGSELSDYARSAVVGLQEFNALRGLLLLSHASNAYIKAELNFLIGNQNKIERLLIRKCTFADRDEIAALFDIEEITEDRGYAERPGYEPTFERHLFNGLGYSLTSQIIWGTTLVRTEHGWSPPNSRYGFVYFNEPGEKTGWKILDYGFDNPSMDGWGDELEFFEDKTGDAHRWFRSLQHALEVAQDHIDDLNGNAD